MKKYFKDPIEPRKKEDGKYPFDFKSPSYDNRSGESIRAGDNYGVGFTQPVGKEKASGLESGAIPMKSKCFDPNMVVSNAKEG